MYYAFNSAPAKHGRSIRREDKCSHPVSVCALSKYPVTGSLLSLPFCVFWLSCALNFNMATATSDPTGDFTLNSKTRRGAEFRDGYGAPTHHLPKGNTCVVVFCLAVARRQRNCNQANAWSVTGLIVECTQQRNDVPSNVSSKNGTKFCRLHQMFMEGIAHETLKTGYIT